ncbi:ParA family protein [Athalassotoga saccharophila]|uniref:Sporulation initiation inhibitor protein Soj n=1 Tax=Athalassotoga saccharophila TaxID=1441386 RepID=A0A6N4TE85_9BACT|nr:ParA family protein [Athalassotoga saccharophila]BBJ29089.1 sporulation initiation inhibitor protein Soj [Athalassotoga saccharophila]
MIKIGIINQKGGVGKTTIAFHLAYLFSRANKKILLIDVDPQGNLTSCFKEALPKENHIKLIYEGQIPRPLEVDKNIFLIGADITLSKYEADAKLANFFKMKNLLDNLSGDIAIIDGPPSLGLFTSNILLASEYVIIPTDMSKFALLGLRDLLDSIENVKTNTNKDLNVLGIILSSVQERLNYHKEIINDVVREYKELMFKTILPESVKVKESISKGRPVFDIYPDAKISKAYLELFEEIEVRLNGKR